LGIWKVWAFGRFGHLGGLGISLWMFKFYLVLFYYNYCSLLCLIFTLLYFLALFVCLYACIYVGMCAWVFLCTFVNTVNELLFKVAKIAFFSSSMYYFLYLKQKNGPLPFRFIKKAYLRRLNVQISLIYVSAFCSDMAWHDVVSYILCKLKNGFDEMSSSFVWLLWWVQDVLFLLTLCSEKPLMWFHCNLLV
jgi:hypothetical protein